MNQYDALRNKWLESATQTRKMLLITVLLFISFIIRAISSPDMPHFLHGLLCLGSMFALGGWYDKTSQAYEDFNRFRLLNQTSQNYL